MSASRREDLVLFLALIAIVIGTVVLANVLPSTERGPPSTAGFGDRDKSCAEWSDGCTVCVRTEHGPFCSTPGIACLRAAPECLKQVGERI